MKLVVAKLARVLLIAAGTVVGFTEIARGPAGLGPDVYLAGAVAAQVAATEETSPADVGPAEVVVRANAPLETATETWYEVDERDLGQLDLGRIDRDAEVAVARTSRQLGIHGFLAR